jgi:DNA (cytosine-5)-methyltransferase 1
MVNQSGTLREMALFAGAGGGILGGHLLGWRTVCAVEWEPHLACVLVSRQNDKILPPFPIWDDVQTFDGRPWKGLVDVVSGGFPCQDISSAGKGAGINGARSGMWREMARIVGEVRPRFVFVENSPLLMGRGAAMVIGDLTTLGYDCRWCIVSASDCGAPHQRDRFWLLAHTNDYEYRANGKQKGKEDEIQGKCGQEGLAREPCRTSYDAEILADTKCKRLPARRDNTGEPEVSEFVDSCKELADTASQRLERQFRSKHQGARVRSTHGSEMADTTSQRQQGQGQSWFSCDPAEKREGETDQSWAERVGHIWGVKSPVGRVADGVAARVDRLKAIGNGQVPVVAATAFRLLAGQKVIP